MAARRATGPVRAIQRGVVDRRGAAALLRAPVVLGDGEGPPTIGRWAMALCEEFVQQLYQAVRAAMALLHALWIVGGDKPLATTPSATALHQRETTDAPASEARRKSNSQPPMASGAAKQPSRLKLGPEATTARKRNLELPSSAIPPRTAPATTRRCSPVRRIPMPCSALGQTRSGDRTVWPSRCKLTSSRLSSPKASASAPTPTSPKNPCAAPLSSSSAALATAPDCKKDLLESATPEVRKLRQQALELFNAVGTVFVLLANLTVTLVYCLVRLSCARFLALVSRREVVAAAA
ncbi:uncharacterized protein LOC119397620 [Rhipicephalus sanguineus]|uniref:Uncharacterized protein n=1 Tax=Rhipicephalus sanguineus TaxID=34632 RepID=A0A9D4PPT5_RHISA|nr:uncharacterized protein LOC119397620 [Rhipicephalus sanguineus]KAH7948098.1 hypothetical protein HPB52_018485 [Rhipicephalus sanguineus]